MTPTPTVTFTPLPLGPEITFFGLAEANGIAVTPVETPADGPPVYERAIPQGFLIVVEARRGPSNGRVSTEVYDPVPGDPEALPDFQIVSSRPLGDGSSLVCDPEHGKVGGVPAVEPAVFSGGQVVADALNDFGCRFLVVGSGGFACTKEPGTLESRFEVAGTERQFCSSPGVGTDIAFPPGDTTLTVRVWDTAGYPGHSKSIVVRLPAQ